MRSASFSFSSTRRGLLQRLSHSTARSCSVSGGTATDTSWSPSIGAETTPVSVPISAEDASRHGSGAWAPLMDTFGRHHNYLRISLTERCNLRCLYCMPEQGVDLTPAPQLLQTDELLRLVRIFNRLGVTKLRLTGGEPLVRKDVVSLCRDMRRAAPNVRQLAITTNGITLPRMIQDLHAAGVTGLNLSLDTLQQDRYVFITRRNGLAKVLDSIKLAEALGYNPVKINCVVMRGVNEDEVGNFAELTRDRALEVRFIEYMPFDDNKWERAKMFSFMETVDAVEKAVGKKLRHESKGETAQLFRVPGYRGRIGFIASMTTAFCSTCNRLRLTADGNLKTCLFGEDELSLRDVLRGGASDEEVAAAIRGAVMEKREAHGGKADAEAIAASSNRPMIKIGG